jgi:hypothetical protein
MLSIYIDSRRHRRGALSVDARDDDHSDRVVAATRAATALSPCELKSTEENLREFCQRELVMKKSRRGIDDVCLQK